MASGTKSDSVFTRNPMGGSPGDSDGMQRQKIMGGGYTYIRAFPQDNVHGVDLPNTMGAELGGSETNLSHSLSGASAVQSVAPRTGKSGKKEI